MKSNLSMILNTSFFSIWKRTCERVQYEWVHVSLHERVHVYISPEINEVWCSSISAWLGRKTNRDQNEIIRNMSTADLRFVTFFGNK